MISQQLSYMPIACVVFRAYTTTGPLNLLIWRDKHAHTGCDGSDVAAKCAANRCQHAAVRSSAWRRLLCCTAPLHVLACRCRPGWARAWPYCATSDFEPVVAS
jgi:hypothetical protein